MTDQYEKVAREIIGSFEYSSGYLENGPAIVSIASALRLVSSLAREAALTDALDAGLRAGLFVAEPLAVRQRTLTLEAIRGLKVKGG